MSDPESQPRLRPDALATSVAILLAMSVVQRCVGFGRGVLFCRWLTPQELGQWEMAYSFLLLAAPIVVFGVPGSLGRYVERYRQRNQLCTFLARAIAWTTILSACAAGLMLLAAPSFSDFIFGRTDKHEIVWLMAFSLLAIIMHHFLEALFAALRLFRVVSAMHFCQSIGFATIALGLLWAAAPAAENIVVAYGVACAISACGTLLWMRGPLAELQSAGESVSHAAFWPPLLRFAIWVWVANLLCHLFGVVDRYMIVHFSGMDNATALAQVGNYHSSRVVPLLFVSMSDLLAGVIVPYFSHDWETGRRDNVVRRLNLMLKLTCLGMLAAGVVVLWAAPWLFGVAFDGKYDDGLAVLPWTLTYCVLYSIMTVAMTYLWCAEHTRICSLPLGIGLAANIVLNLLWLPIWGLLGAVLATTVATALSLAALYAIATQIGMTFHRGTLWLTCVPIVLCAGPLPATAMLAAVLALAVASDNVFTTCERQELGRVIHERAGFLQNAWRRPTSA